MTKGTQQSASVHPLSLNAQRQGRKGKMEATSLTKIPPTQTTKAFEVPMGGRTSQKDERYSNNNSAEEEDGYYEPLQDNNIPMIPEINDALSSGRKEVRAGGAMLTNIIDDK